MNYIGLAPKASLKNGLLEFSQATVLLQANPNRLPEKFRLKPLSRELCAFCGWFLLMLLCEGGTACAVPIGGLSGGSAGSTDTSQPVVSALACASSVMSREGADLCTVTLSEPAPASGVRVSVTSSNAAVTVSAIVLVHANATTAQFAASVVTVSTPQTISLTAGAGSVVKSFALQLNAPVPDLSVTSTAVAFGSVPVTIPVVRPVAIKSSGTGTLTISGATVSGSGFSLANGSFPISLAPGQTALLSVQFNPRAQGTVAGQLKIASNSSTNQLATIALTGTGTPQVSGLFCNNAAMSGAGTNLCTVTISGPAPGTGTRVGVSSSTAAVAVSDVVLVHANATSAQFTASVTAVSTAQTATLTANAGSLSKSFAFQLNAPTPHMTIAPTSVAFGSVSVTVPVVRVITVKSTGTGPVTLTGMTISGTGFSLAQGDFPVSLNPGQTALINVQFDPLAQGDAAGQLTIASNSSTSDPTVVALSGSGTPQVSSISCNDQAMVGTATNLCTVTISGPAPAVGFRVALSSSTAALTLPSAAFVPANSTSAQFTASATPVSTTQTATLTAGAGQVSKPFTLRLEVPVPNLSVTSGSVVFGNVPLTVVAVRKVVLSSTGTGPVTINGATVSGAGFSLTQSSLPISLNPGQTAVVSVLFNPLAQEATSGQLTIASNSSANNLAVVALSGSGAAAGTFTYTGSQLESTLTAPNPSTPISRNFFGMTIHHTATPFPAFPVSTIRLGSAADWLTVEPGNGAYDWSHLDTAILIGNANGVRDYIFTFGSVPAWASTNPTDPCTNGNGPGSCAPPNMTAFDEFTTRLVQRSCGTIKYYETWNEPNNTPYWDGTNAQLLTVAQHLYSIAKDPANCGCTNGTCGPNGGLNPNKVIMPSISAITPGNLSWLDTYLAGTGEYYPYADVAAFHGYHVTNPEDIAAQVTSLNQLLANHGLGDLELWNTEASWGSLPVTTDQQASWLMRYHMVMATSNVTRFVWFAYDDCYWGTLWEAPWCSNPQLPTGQVTPPGQAYAVIESWMSGANLSSCQQYENGLWACELKRSGGFDAWMLWSSTGAGISVPIPSNSNALFYKDWQNNLNDLPSEIVVTQMPVLLENQPL